MSRTLPAAGATREFPRRPWKRPPSTASCGGPTCLPSSGTHRRTGWQRSPVTYVYLDAGWAMFRARTSASHTAWDDPPGQQGEVEGAGPCRGTQRAGRGGRVERPPRRPTRYLGDERGEAQEVRVGAVSPPELRVRLLHVAVPSDLLRGRDVKSAMADLSAKAKSHARTSCKQ